MIDLRTKILLVEDSSNDAELTLLALQKESLDQNVQILRDGAEAIHFLTTPEGERHPQSRDFNMMFLDLKLPKRNGFEVLEVIRKIEAFDTFPIIVLTSSGVEHDIRRAYSLGVNSYIVKPIDFNSHASAVREAAKYWLNINKTPT